MTIRFPFGAGTCSGEFIGEDCERKSTMKDRCGVVRELNLGGEIVVIL